MVLEHQILGRVAGKSHLGKNDYLRSRSSRFSGTLHNPVRISRKGPYGGV